MLLAFQDIIIQMISVFYYVSSLLHNYQSIKFLNFLKGHVHDEIITFRNDSGREEQSFTRKSIDFCIKPPQFGRHFYYKEHLFVSVNRSRFNVQKTTKID